MLTEKETFCDGFLWLVVNVLEKTMPLPFGLKLKRTRRYTVSSKSCLVARIQLLNNEFVEFTLSVESTGQESLEAVAQRLELREVGNGARGCGSRHSGVNVLWNAHA